MSRASTTKRAIAIGAAIAVAALAHASAPALANAPAPQSQSEQHWRGATDPLEPLNRRLYSVNRVLQDTVLRPVMFLVLTVLPKPVQKGLHNVLNNLGEPATVANDLLQLKIGKAAVATGRFVSNSTLGLLGLLDVATDEGLPHHATDFGLTLGRYGVPTGPYLFVPVVGPSSLRDTGARLVSGTIDPVSHLHFHGDGAMGTGRTILSTVETEADIQDEDRAGDPYVATRTAYLERRGLPARPAFEVVPGDVADRGDRQAAFAAVSGSFFTAAQ